MKRSADNRNPFLFGVYKYFIIIIAVIMLFHFLYENSSIFYKKTFTLPFSLHLNRQDLYLIKGEEFHLYVFGINKRVSFSSTNFRVAGVNFNGRVFAYRTGKAFILARVDGRELKCRVHVVDINKKNLKLREGETYRLKIRGSHAFVQWRSKDKSIATVSMFGKVKAAGKGSTIIYGKVKGKSIKCRVEVD